MPPTLGEPSMFIIVYLEMSGRFVIVEANEVGIDKTDYNSEWHFDRAPKYFKTEDEAEAFIDDVLMTPKAGPLGGKVDRCWYSVERYPYA